MNKKLSDMTIRELAEYEEIPTARPRTDMVLVKDLRKWAEAKDEELEKKYQKKLSMKGFLEPIKAASYIKALQLWLRDNFNLADSDE